MMRERKPFWKKSHGCWYFRHNGRDIRLDPDKAKAWEKWHAIVGGRTVDKDTPLIELTNRFLEWSEKHNAPRTFAQYRDHLKSFHDHVGRLRFSSFKPHHVTGWIDSRYPKGASPNTVHLAIRSVQRMLNWNRKQGWIDAVPHIEKPKPTPRDAYLTPEQFSRIIAAIADQEFLDFVTILRETGCRPLEARSVEARHVHGDCWEFAKEDAKGGLEPRVILLNERAQSITRRLMKEHPTGPLFRNSRGRVWSKDTLNWRCKRLRDKLGFPICCYAIRHTFATDAIVRGVDVVSIARLMGHKDLTMLNRVYQHVQKRGDHLRAALRAATNTSNEQQVG